MWFSIFLFITVIKQRLTKLCIKLIPENILKVADCLVGTLIAEARTPGLSKTVFIFIETISGSPSEQKHWEQQWISLRHCWVCWQTGCFPLATASASHRMLELHTWMKIWTAISCVCVRVRACFFLSIEYLQPLPPSFPDDVPPLWHQFVLDHFLQLRQHLAGHHGLGNKHTHGYLKRYSFTLLELKHSYGTEEENILKEQSERKIKVDWDKIHLLTQEFSFQKSSIWWRVFKIRCTV